ncbi:IPT/TIG domain-containing protein [Myxococcota bacterium]|nr:IPT/TIG domain-containing protein [Myxococcota bacterium]MBU1382072.1 IPT/TIG domain-containing protein [Myxococcota bacterium]MBU1496186.1 IPT/TIG domain-containing protein [Myxococcota bacterium]
MKKYFPLLILVLGCSKPNPWKIVATMDLDESSKKPVVTRVIDGNTKPASTEGILKDFAPDGVFTTAETVVIRGRNFGRLPTVSICDKPTVIIARTEDGGIISRVPLGIPAGQCPVTVSNTGGTSAPLIINVSRYAAVAVPGSGSFAILDTLTWKELAVIKKGETQFLAFNSDTPVLYAAVKGNCSGNKCPSILLTVDLTTKGGPSVVSEEKIPGGNLLALSYSPVAKTVTAVSNHGLRVFNAAYPLTPVAHRVHRWPAELKASTILSAGVSRDGKLVAVNTTTDNQVHFFDIQVPDVMKKGVSLNLLPDEKARLLKYVDLIWDGSAQYLIALSGDTTASLVVGYHPSFMLMAEVVSPMDNTKDIIVKTVNKTPTMMEKFTPVSVNLVFHGINQAEEVAHSKWKRYYYILMAHSELLPLGKLPMSTPSGAQKAREIFKSVNETTLAQRLDEKNNPKQFIPAKGIYGTMKVAPWGSKALTVKCLPSITGDDFKVTIPCGYEIIDLAGNKNEFRKGGTMESKNMLPPFRFGAAAFQD